MKPGENLEAAARRCERAVQDDYLEDVVIRFVDGKLRDISQDGEFFTVIEGEWFRLERMCR